MLQPIYIRRLRPEDANQVIYLENLCFDYPLGEYTIHTYLRAKNNISLGAFENDKLIGALLCNIDSNEGHIVLVAVHPEYRRRGIGKTLMLSIENYCMEKLVRRLKLEVNVSNAPAINMYQKLGYRAVDIIRGYYENGDDAFLMVKQLL